MAELEQFQQFGAKQKEMWTNLKRLGDNKNDIISGDMCLNSIIYK